MSKGDNPRPVNKEVFDREFLRIFGERKKIMSPPSSSVQNTEDKPKPSSK